VSLPVPLDVIPHAIAHEIEISLDSLAANLEPPSNLADIERPLPAKQNRQSLHPLHGRPHVTTPRRFSFSSPVWHRRPFA
jgi:hypothetical protein